MAQDVVSKSGKIEIKYDGLIAADHRIDMRRFGYALVGLDHIVTVGVVALLDRRLAKPRERVNFEVVVSEPKEGSVGFIGDLMAVSQGGQASLPFIVQLINDKVPDLIWYWVSWVFKKLGGREKEADKLMEKMLDMMEKIHDREKLDRQAERDFLFKVIDRLAPNASQMATLVGDSANVLRIGRADGEWTEIGVPEAAAIRSKEPLEVGDPTQMQVRIDAITMHSNKGLVELPQSPGRYVAAEFRDPLFDTRPSPYIAALDSGNLIDVVAVPSLRAGELHRLYIMSLARDTQ